MNLPYVFLFIFCVILVSMSLINYIKKRHRTKQLLLTPIIIKPKVKLNPILQNQCIGIAISNTFEYVFSKIHGVYIKDQVIQIIKDINQWDSNQTCSILDLSERLSRASNNSDDPDVAYWLKELSTGSVAQLETMVDHAAWTRISSTDLSALVTYCLNNVTLAELEYA